MWVDRETFAAWNGLRYVEKSVGIDDIIRVYHVHLRTTELMPKMKHLWPHIHPQVYPKHVFDEQIDPLMQLMHASNADVGR